MAKIGDQLGADIIAAMKAREQEKLTALRMVKAALKSKEIDKREPLTDAEEQAALTTMLKQRRESVDSFTKGGRAELAAKEQAEIVLIETYMPQAAEDEELCTIVENAIKHVTHDNGGTRPGPKDMGTVMKIAQQYSLTNGIRADGKKLSELVKAELAKG